MPGGREPEDWNAGSSDELSLLQRFLLALPRLKHDRDRAPLGERLRDAMLKPPKPDSSPPAKPAKPLSVDELEAEDRFADDKERLIGLLAAPIAALIGIVITSDLISHDPAGRKHVPVSDYHELTIVLVGLAAVMLATAWFRKRLYLGMATALYGLAVFNLHYWGFGVPFVMVGAWLLVRAYRAHRAVREATGDLPSRGSPTRRKGAPAPRVSGPQSNKRFTPRTSPSKMRRVSQHRPEKQQRAG